MFKAPLRGNDFALPAEIVAEISDGVALGLDALDAERLSRRNIEEATGHLRFAQRRLRDLISTTQQGA